MVTQSVPCIGSYRLIFQSSWCLVYSGSTLVRHGVVDTSSKVTLHRFESRMLAIGACVDSDSPFSHCDNEQAIFVLFEAVSPKRAFW